MVETELDFDTLVGRVEETESVEGELELGADTDEDASLGLYAILPAELQRQDVFVLVRLQWERKCDEKRWKTGEEEGEGWIKKQECLMKQLWDFYHISFIL